MLRVSSRPCHRRVLVSLLVSLSALLFLLSLMAYAQSLGDAARENRDKKADVSTPPPKVITNRDLPKNPDGYSGPPASENVAPTTPESAPDSQQAAQQRAAEQRAAERWRRRIQTQENVVANLEARVDHLRAYIHLADPNAPYDSGTMAFNAYQARQLARLNQMQHQLNQEKQKLENLQEAARHAGMHTLVYDP